MKQDFILPLYVTIIAFIVALILHYSGADLHIHKTAVALCSADCETIGSWLTRLGDGWVQVLICCVLGTYYYRKTRYNLSRAWFLAAPLSLIAGAFGQIIKFTFGRPRPKLLPEYDFQWFEVDGVLRGFPSGHTLTSFAIAGIVAGYYGLGGKIVLFTLATLIGLSRITTHNHFAADVVFGAALGYFFGVLLKIISMKNKVKEPNEPR